MKILVTGATGFIGQKLVPKLAAGHELTVVCRPGSGSVVTPHRVLEADLNAPAVFFDELKKISPDVCIHLAWEGIPDYGFNISRNNLMQAAQLWQHLVLECGCRKIVTTGSCWEYGKAFGACREDEPLAVSDSYFVWAKRALCELGMTLAAKQGISFIWSRLFYVYGDGQRSGALIPTLTDVLSKGGRPLIKTPHNANDFVHVEDVAEGLALAAHKELPSGIYNFGSGHSTPVWKVCEILERAMGSQARYAAELSASSVPASADFRADTAKTKDVLGWSARTGLEEGIHQYLKGQGIQA
ncbi:MAG: NAD(P)-dependent oxidoreductase [Candidatus Omnitrophica bacterium]|nr:NAD(P)-dependent oxidoreductase [Candidatus Omnitrophota bacterium]